MSTAFKTTQNAPPTPQSSAICTLRRSVLRRDAAIVVAVVAVAVVDCCGGSRRIIGSGGARSSRHNGGYGQVDGGERIQRHDAGAVAAAGTTSLFSISRNMIFTAATAASSGTSRRIHPLQSRPGAIISSYHHPPATRAPTSERKPVEDDPHPHTGGGVMLRMCWRREERWVLSGSPSTRRRPQKLAACAVPTTPTRRNKRPTQRRTVGFSASSLSRLVSDN